MIKYQDRIVERFASTHKGYSLVKTRGGTILPPDLPPIELPPDVEPQPFVFNVQYVNPNEHFLYLTFRPPIDDSPWSMWNDTDNIELANSDGYLHESVSWWQGTNGYREVTVPCNDTLLRQYSVHGSIDVMTPGLWPNDYDYNWPEGYSVAANVNVLSWSNQIRRYEFRMEATHLIVPETIPSHITSFCQMFFGCTNFNQDISMWDVSNVTDFSYMFLDCEGFNAPLNDWDMRSAVTIEQILCNCLHFNQPVDGWNVSNVEYMTAAFSCCWEFDQPLGSWNVSKVTDMGGLFDECLVFNQDISMWDVSSMTNAAYLFDTCRLFNQDLSKWDVSNVSNMEGIFTRCSSFNQDISSWNVSNVTNFSQMFSGCVAFNQPLGTWNMSKATTIAAMFNSCTAFNQPIGNWDISNVTALNSCFAYNCGYNQPLDDWNTSNVTNMSYMFHKNGTFNQPIGNWNVSNVLNMDYMFGGNTAFNQDLSQWCTSTSRYAPTEFNWTRYPSSSTTQWTLPKPVWGTCPRNEFTVKQPRNLIEFNITSSTDHTTSDGVQIISDGSSPIYEIYRDDVLIMSDKLYSSDITRVDENVGNVFTINRNPSGTVNYKIYSMNRQLIGFRQKNKGVNQVVPLKLEVIRIPTDPIPRMAFSISFSTYKVELVVTAGLPKAITYCANMFKDCHNFNSSLAHWDTSAVTDMSSMFSGCTVFNQDISTWDVSKVSSMGNMFLDCKNFNQSLLPWNVAFVTNMYSMLSGCTSYNQDLSNWCTLSITQEPEMFSQNTTSWLLPKPTWGTCLSSHGFKFKIKPNRAVSESLRISLLDRTDGTGTWVLLDMVTGERLADYTGYSILNGTVKLSTNYRYPTVIDITIDSNDLREYELVCAKANVTIKYLGKADINDIGKLPPEAVLTVLQYSSHIETYSFDAGFAELIVPDVMPNHMTDASMMFAGSYLFNQDISMWDVSKITTTSKMFWDCASFNQNIGAWDVSNVTKSDDMFSRCISFNQDISRWNVSNIVDMSEMFYGCSIFNQDLSRWNVAKLSRIPWDFAGAALKWTLPKPVWSTTGTTI